VSGTGTSYVIEGAAVAPANAPATLSLEGAVKQASDTCRARMVVLAICFLAAFVVVGGRLVEVMAVPISPDVSIADSGPVAPIGRHC
jgi:hypothetical protein